MQDLTVYCMCAFNGATGDKWVDWQLDKPSVVANMKNVKITVFSSGSEMPISAGKPGLLSRGTKGRPEASPACSGDDLPDRGQWITENMSRPS
jgi:hypothetical protein